MRMAALVRQTMFLSCSHFFVRVIGFVMRIWLSRELGPQAMGLVELAQSAQMLLITPVISGLPAAVSRMSAKSDKPGQVRVLRCGLALALGVSLPLTAAAFCLREPLALWLGDVRTLPALVIYLPCIPILGASCALNGYYYGTGRPVPPALSEILEQIVRFLLCLRLVTGLRGWPMMLRAAIPAAAALVGETIGLLLMLLIALKAIFFSRASGSRRTVLREMIFLALPLTGMKLVHSLMRTVNATLIPARLQLSGLSAAESLSRLGMMNGMMMPVLMMPSFITGSLCMVAAPELTRRQQDGRPLRNLVLRVLGATLGIGAMAMLAVYAAAPLIAQTLYRQAELLPMLRRCCLLVPVLSLNQVTGGMMNGLGLQSASLRISLVSSLLSVLLMYLLAALPALRLWGAILAMACAQLLTLALSGRALLHAIGRRGK
ncbi:MAG: oligosaccharide flippase family protein [Clostridia bacterium]|nr:oligosaccharide flippase family protein [Clostridia bacterium]